ncbi:DUF262 domain-containing protein [uncultured Chryseobacterium sp.]|uniref:DUF262 domain-containing protein n=1 Tax=uncultured Chryseobacterium sp. TaxID=259322 RepID=UPI0025DF3734|nr:DUF262 domain-containing protein [uncultured Chryseobacterium sp.]
MSEFLNTTLRNVAWFKGAFERKELDMKPPFQRNPVWVTKQKSYLIDTILNAFPIPEIYMQETVDENGSPKYIIVDGQQRTRAFLEYLEGGFCIDAKESPELGDLYFDDLSSDQKRDFFKYNFVIRILPDIRDEELREIFQRLNKNVVSLNKQELRQATYWGDFIKIMNKISDKEYWNKIDVFTPNDVRRMLDVEYISELAIYYLHGFQNKKDNLDKFYELYEESFDEKDHLTDVFDTVVGEINKILPTIAETRWRKKSDFYSLFGIFSKNYKNLPLSRDKRELARAKLIDFGEEIDLAVKTDRNNDFEISEAVKEYFKGIRATTDLGSRKNRENGLSIILRDVFI